MIATLPLLAARDLAQPLCWRAGQAVSAAQFIAQAQAQALAEQLPAGRPVNLCHDRYHFALGLAAALLRGQTSLMPPNALAQTLRQLPAAGGSPYLLVDDDSAADAGLRQHRVGCAADLPAATQVPQIAADLQAVCLLTSGSTGAPQPHVKSWGSLVANSGAQARRLAELLQRPSLTGITLVATVPAQHSYGFESSVLLAMLGGACFDAARPYFPADIVAALQRVGAPRALVTTPFHLKTLLLSGLQAPPVALTLSATAPLGPQLAAQAEAVLGGPLIEIYGCTEAGQVASRRTTAGQTWHTLGELRLSRRQTADGETYVVAGGHVQQPTPLADVLELQGEQHFRLLGRTGDLIHVAGKRSSLAHLNFQLNRIEGVQDGAFWLPDEVSEGVVRPLAFVVAPTLDAAAVIAALRPQLDAAFVPRRVVMVDALPREATGKLTAAALRHFALAHGGDTACMTRFDVPRDHPAFDGHFPGHPVLPGVAVLALVWQALAARAELASRLGPQPRIDNAKFLHAVGPGARLRVTLQAQGAGVAFSVHAGLAVVARGQFAPDTAPEAAAVVQASTPS